MKNERGTMRISDKRLSIPAALAAIDLELMISHHVGSPQKAVCMQGAHIVMLKKKEKEKERALFLRLTCSCAKRSLCSSIVFRSVKT